MGNPASRGPSARPCLRLVAALTALAAVLVIVACGGSDDGESSSSAPVSGPAAGELLQVTTTANFITDLARGIGGEQCPAHLGTLLDVLCAADVRDTEVRNVSKLA